MKRFLYDKTKKYDDGFRMICEWMKKAAVKNDDDFLLTIVGSTGTGKSRLALHGLDYVCGEKADAEQIGLDREQFANALKYASKMAKPKLALYDEANVNRRDSMTSYNKDLIDLYLSIRGDNIIHLWCNPTIEMLDKHFIEERLSGCIYIFTKDMNRPRLYYYFRQKDLLKVLAKFGNLKRETLKKAARKYAFYRGWFKDYDGFLLDEYMAKKNPRIKDKIENFWEKYGSSSGKKISRVEMAKKLGVNRVTLAKHEKNLPADMISRSSGGRVFYLEEAAELFHQIMREKYEKNLKNIV